MKELEKQLKQNNISSCYLFYGTEQYLKTQYTNLLKKKSVRSISRSNEP